MPKFKKFILFEYSGHEPGGGLDDIQDSFDTLEDAVHFMEKRMLIERYTCWEIIDRDTWEILKEAHVFETKGGA